MTVQNVEAELVTTGRTEAHIAVSDFIADLKSSVVYAP